MIEHVAHEGSTPSQTNDMTRVLLELSLYKRCAVDAITWTLKHQPSLQASLEPLMFPAAATAGFRVRR